MCSEGHVASVVIAAGFLGVLAWRSTQSREESGPGLQLTHRAKLQHIQQKRAELTHTHAHPPRRQHARTHTHTHTHTHKHTCTHTLTQRHRDAHTHTHTHAHTHANTH